MSLRFLLGAAALAACDPVLLIADTTGEAEISQMPPQAAADKTTAEHAAGSAGQAGRLASNTELATPVDTNTSTPSVKVTIRYVDCADCFALTASGLGGVPPYRFEWDDGSISESRLVCLRSSELVVSVVAEDATGARSNASILNLRPDNEGTSGCPENQAPAALCLINPSFEGTAAINTGQGFDAKPWSDCVDATAAVAAANGSAANTPDIASDALDPVTGIAPRPTQGITYLAMTAGEQASQPLCKVLPAHAKTSLRLDAMRFDLGGPELHLQIWSGEASSCSGRQQLWSSPALQTVWQNYCVTLDPDEAMDQITLRADTPMPVSTLMATYIAVDNIIPVDSCP